MKKIGMIALLLLLTIQIGCQSEDVATNIVEETETNTEEVSEEVEETEVENTLPKVRIDVEILNFRSSPNAEAEKLGEVYQGCVYEILKTEEVEKTDKTETWYLIKVGDEVGWVAGWYTVATDETPKDFLVKDLSYDFQEFYNIGDALHLPEEENMVILLNDEPVVENFVFSKAGMYEAKLRYTDGLGRTVESLKIDLQVIDDLTFRIYKHFSDDEPEERVVKLDELEFTGKIIIDDGIWYECVSLLYKGYIKPDHGLYPISEVNEIGIVTNNEVILGDFIFQTDGSENCLHLENENAEHTFIHLKSGKIVEWSYAYEFKNDDQLLLYMLPVHFHQANKQKTESFALYDLASETCDQLFATEDSFAYLEVLEDGTYRSGRISRDPWYSTNHSISNEIVDVKNIDGIWQLAVLSTPIVKEDKTFNVYSDLNTSKLVGEYKPSKVANIESMDIYDIIDEELVMWFKITLPSGSYGYAYRPRWNYEESSILITKDFYLKLDNGELTKFEGEYDGYFLVRDLTEAFIPMNAYAVTRSYEGSSTLVYTKDDGSVIKEFSDTNIYTFPTTKKLLFEQWGYGEPYLKIQIFDIGSDQFVEEFIYESDKASISTLDIIDDDHISFTIESDKSYPASLDYVDGEWIVTSEYE